MKSLFVVLALLMATSLYAQNAEEETATVYFMRSTGVQGSISKVNAFIDGELVCKLNNYQYSTHQVTPGKREFVVQRSGKKLQETARTIEIDVQPGETYYITAILETDFFVNQVYCQEVTQNSALTVLPRLQADEKCL